MNDFLRLNKIGLTVWESFKRRPKFNKKEKLLQNYAPPIQKMIVRFTIIEK
jgi:hypothetical protein